MWQISFRSPEPHPQLLSLWERGARVPLAYLTVGYGSYSPFWEVGRGYSHYIIGLNARLLIFHRSIEERENH
jgi:hypothetical protein